MKGVLFVAWPLSFISEDFAWFYLVACSLNVLTDWTVAPAGVAFWMLAIGVDYVGVYGNFMISFIGELVIWGATVGLNALFIKGVVDWYYFGILK